ncbi:MAG TPA: hypothetical protein VGK73_08870 [Polyangiaceae bacterium]
MSTLIGMPATSVVLAAPVDPRRWPFAAAVISGDQDALRYADEAEKVAETTALLGDIGPGVFSASWELKQIAAAVRRVLMPTRAPIPALSPRPFGMSVEDFYRSRFD